MTESNVYRLVAVSFGFLCLIQVSLNVFLRLTFWGNTLELQTLTEERDELKKKLNDCTNFHRDGWRYFNGSVYYVSDVAKDWRSSRKDCLRMGADLMVISSREEQLFTAQLKDDLWIGLTDSEEEGAWRWVDGTPLTRSFWIDDEPNSFQSREEDCVEVRFHQRTNSWNDEPCDWKNYYVCEKQLFV